MTVPRLYATVPIDRYIMSTKHVNRRTEAKRAFGYVYVSGARRALYGLKNRLSGDVWFGMVIAFAGAGSPYPCTIMAGK